MTPAHDRLSIPRLRRHLDTEVVGHHIYLLGTVESTSTVLRRLAEAGAAEGTVVLAEAQFLSASVLFRPELSASDVAVFAPIASLAMAEAVEAEDLGANLNVTRAELEGALGRERAAAATSVSELTGAPVDPNALTTRFLGLLEKWHRIFVTEGPEVVLAAWRARGALRERAA